MIQEVTLLGRKIPLCVHFKVRGAKVFGSIQELIQKDSDRYPGIPFLIEAFLDGFILTVKAHVTGNRGHTVQSIREFGFCQKCITSFKTNEWHPDNGCPLGVVDVVMSN